ncbi:MAG: hypothetical protein EVA65_16460 [Oceanococcus sp.]|nr:MAG: hypothetical protein EVA65_16460 [Oceanococcus sp.]
MSQDSEHTFNLKLSDRSHYDWTTKESQQIVVAWLKSHGMKQATLQGPRGKDGAEYRGAVRGARKRKERRLMEQAREKTEARK